MCPTRYTFSEMSITLLTVGMFFSESVFVHNRFEYIKKKKKILNFCNFILIINVRRRRTQTNLWGEGAIAPSNTGVEACSNYFRRVIQTFSGALSCAGPADKRRKYNVIASRRFGFDCRRLSYFWTKERTPSPSKPSNIQTTRFSD